MNFPERFSDLPEYAFPRLRGLLDAHAPGKEPIVMTIGEPMHEIPPFVAETVAEHAPDFRRYPPNEGDPEHEITVLNGTREGLYNAAMAICPEEKGAGRPVVLVPNPFYQVYAVAALSVGAEPHYVPATAENGFLPDYAALPRDLLDRTAIAYICSPSNPQGAVAGREYWEELIALAERHDFTIFADECYSEIYRDAPPPGALEIAREMGADPERVLIFHSLSKRSNLAGLRSGFVAGGPRSLAHIKKLRAYAGAPLPLPLQHVAVKAWNDDAHVLENRAQYQEKYGIADGILSGLPGYRPPQAGFFLWIEVEDGEEAALKLWREEGVRVLPGAYLGRDGGAGNPGKKYIRAAMVAPKEEMRRGLERLRSCLQD